MCCLRWNFFMTDYWRGCHSEKKRGGFKKGKRLRLLVQRRWKIQHLFFECSFSQRIWIGIFNWCGVQGPVQQSIIMYFLQFGALLRKNKSKKKCFIVWMATVWCMWTSRNKIIFDGNVADYLGSWSWFAGHNAGKLSYSFADWCNNPLTCIDSHIWNCNLNYAVGLSTPCTCINTILLITRKGNK